MAKQLMPKAELEPRSSDVPATDEQILKIGLFTRLKRKPTLDKFPGALVVRRYRKGEVLFRQGEAGWTAFYILTSEDLLAIEGRDKTVLPPGQKAPEPSRTLMPEELEALLDRVEDLQKSPERDEELRTVATVNLAIARPGESGRTGWLGRLGRSRERGRSGRADRPLYIPIDAPRDLDYESLQTDLYEGELFGEMSCLYGTPRSATIVATRDCYMLELLRNILDQVQKDPGYKAQTDEVYKKHIFDMHLRPLPIFRELSDEQFNQIRPKLDLVTFDAGQLICDEHERPDHMYVVRGGLVRVIKKSSSLLSPESVRNWPDLCVALREGEQQPASPRGKIWQLLAPAAKSVVAGLAAGGDPAEKQRLELRYALNDVIKQRELADAKEFQEILSGAQFLSEAGGFPTKKRKDWSDQDIRRFNRLLLESIFPRIIRQHRRRVGPECVLSYSSRGDYVGEISLVEAQPRVATCIAHGHPQEDNPGKETGQVELVKIPAAVFWEIMESCPKFRVRLEKEVADRSKRNRLLAAAAVFEDANQVLHSQEAERLGLIQGQRLMLIDLERCTRCDECVKACVNTHDDGRSRLFLDGPRFDRYLVPTTCRSCLDPVCMVGCPVGSIHRGNNGQIEIEDWCIGCGLCANNCPYGSIQMHDIGIIQEKSRGWRFCPSDAVSSEKWYSPRFDDQRWALGDAPFYYDRNFHNLLLKSGKDENAGRISSKDRLVYFRLEFRLASYLLKPGSQFKLELTSSDAAAGLWVNGTEIQPEKPKAGKREYWLPAKVPAAAGPNVQAAPPPQLLRAGRNVFAVKVKPTPQGESLLLDLRLDALSKPMTVANPAEEVTIKLVTERAVVCDLCSSSWGQVPACVNACPHDAAMRVDARSNFPVR